MSKEDLRGKLRQAVMFGKQDKFMEDAIIHQKFCNGLLTREQAIEELKKIWQYSNEYVRRARQYLIYEY